jgi:carbohydrate kinase (thermoresistant glucokinase family)
MGVSGCGKSTIAARLAGRLGWQFAEADEFHSSANVAKMRGGTPLTDEDRRPWLEAIARWIDAARAAGRPAIVACSALKRSYRDVLIGPRKDVRLVYLKGGYELVARRLAARAGHYMPLALLDSQFATLEEPMPDEQAIVVGIERGPEEIVEAILAALGPQ